MAGSIDLGFGGFNEVVKIAGIVMNRQWERLDGICPEALQPRLDGVRFKPDQAMNATERDLVLGDPEIQCRGLDVEPSR